MKTKPYGIRFDIGQLEFIKTEQNLGTPQQVVNFLLNQYYWSKHAVTFPPSGVVSPPEPIATFMQPEPQGSKWKKGYQFFLRNLKLLDNTQEACDEFLAELRDSQLSTDEKKKLETLLKNR